MDLSGLFTLVALGAVFYLMIIRPQQKRNKMQLELQSSLEPGDRVMTYSGIYATVIEVGDPLVVRIADGVDIEIVPGAISGRVEATDKVDADEPVDVAEAEPADVAELEQTTDADSTVMDDPNA